MRQFGQLAVIAARQILAHFEQNILHDIEVVQQPLGVGCERDFALRHQGDTMMGVAEDATVLPEARQQDDAGAMARFAGGACQLSGVDF